MLQSITFRLGDSLPTEVLGQIAQNKEPARCRRSQETIGNAEPPACNGEQQTKGNSGSKALEGNQQRIGNEERLAYQRSQAAQQRDLIDAALDQGHGSCWLAHQEVAQLVEDALHHFDGQRYRLIAWCVMPNHVHVLIETLQAYPLAGVLHSWKSFTAKAINRHLGQVGEVWQREFFDRQIRDEAHLQAAITYIEGNPVAAGLALRAQDWRFSSASQSLARADDTPTPTGASSASRPF